MISEKTTNQLVIQGIFKEAFFNDSIFNLNLSTEIIKLRIVDISESKIRDKSENKRINFRLVTGKPEFLVGRVYLVSTRFHRYTITAELKYDHESNGEFVFYFPSELLLENLRKVDRTKVQIQIQKPTPVILRSGNLHTEGAFVLEDTSADGFGGTLTVVDGYPIQANMKVFGRVGLSSELAEIKGSIVSALPLNPIKSGFNTYRVGIKQEGNDSCKVTDVAIYSGSDRRSQQRYKTILQIILESKLHPGQYIILDIDDISINGFSGKINNSSIMSLVPIGSIFQIKDESCKVRMVQFVNDRFHFHVYHRSAEDGIAWMKKMTPLMYPGAKSSTRDNRDLYRIFLQAGAVSTQYLKRHQLFNELLVNSSLSVEDENCTIHRWYVGNTNSGVYVSAIKVGNYCWMVGDIVKEADSNLDGKKIVRSFLKSFSEFSISQPNVGTMMIFWTKKHPFWSEWENKIKQKIEFVSCQVEMAYFRLDSTPKPFDNYIFFKKIEKNDYVERKKIIGNLSESLKVLLRLSFDFDENGIESLYRRKFFYLKTKKGELLGFLNLDQNGNSINRFNDSCFLVPINYEVEHIESELDEILGVLIKEYNVLMPSVRVFHDQNKDIGTPMTCFLLYPTALSTF